MPNGKELLQELKCLVSGDHIDEETFRRLLLTAMIGVLNTLEDNPMISLGTIAKKHPKVFWFAVALIILFFTLVDARQVMYDFWGLPIKITPIP